MEQIPQPILYTVIAGLCGVIAYMAKLWIAHHEESVRDMRAERARLLKVISDFAEAFDRNTQTTAHLVTSMFFIPKELMRESMDISRKIEEEVAKKREDERRSV